MSFFDHLDRRHRQPDPVRPEPMVAGQDCPAPLCRGHMEVRPCADCKSLSLPICGCPYLRLVCDRCGWTEEKRS